ncbi:MAG TPA: HAD-IA family hydrolase [Bryobacteraceae bacterium]|nr:HAD-IA family hydrolase [Bryobacteraceae bacterium]
MIPAFPVYLFDVDGTLVDSARDICGAVQTVLALTSRPDVPFEYLRSYIGRDLIDLFEDLFPDAPAHEIERLIHQYRCEYPARDHANTVAFPRVKETLAALPGRKSTATTKGTPTTRLVLERFGLLPYFDHVQGTDGFPHKPAPDVLLKSLDVFGVTAADALFVGDSAADMEAGRRAGVRTCAVRYGYGDIDEMARFDPDYWIDDIAELLPARRKNHGLHLPGNSRDDRSFAAQPDAHL